MAAQRRRRRRALARCGRRRRWRCGLLAGRSRLPVLASGAPGGAPLRGCARVSLRARGRRGAAGARNVLPGPPRSDARAPLDLGCVLLLCVSLAACEVNWRAMRGLCRLTNHLSTGCGQMLPTCPLSFQHPPPTKQKPPLCRLCALLVPWGARRPARLRPLPLGPAHCAGMAAALARDCKVARCETGTRALCHPSSACFGCLKSFNACPPPNRAPGCPLCVLWATHNSWPSYPPSLAPSRPLRDTRGEGKSGTPLPMGSGGYLW